MAHLRRRRIRTSPLLCTLSRTYGHGHRGRIQRWKLLLETWDNRSDSDIYSPKLSRRRPRPWSRTSPLQRPRHISQRRSLSPRTGWMTEIGCDVESSNLGNQPKLARGRRLYNSLWSSKRSKSVSCVTVKPLTIPPLPIRRLAELNDVDPIDTLCATCRNINAEKLLSASGYHHLTLRKLKRSSKSCRFCAWLRNRLPRHWSGQSIIYIKDGQIRSSRHRICLKDGQISIEGATKSIYPPRRFEYFARELDPAVDLGVPFRRHLTNTRSDASFEVARSWVADCCANRGSHGEPDMAEPQGQSVGNIAYQHPTRLIDLQATSDGLERLALIDTRTINPGSYTYCTLSYCWGKQINPSWITTKANLQDRRAGFDRAELPATLSDAIFIAQRLGLRYIWIDAICIVQDDDDDWALEGLKMAGIYKGSHLTIAAALGYSSTDGAFNKQSTYHLEGCKDIVRIDSSLSDGRRSTLYFYAYSLSPRPYQHVEDNSLTTRAWCLQEILLSSRILYYTKAQLLWQCNHIRLQEDGVVEPRHFDNPETLNDILYGADLEIPRDGAPALTIYERINLWCFALVPQYTERKLARGGDKLVAISAIARVISLNTGAEYLAGLWRDMLLISLLWYRISSGKKTSSYRCPSWSWASQDSAVKYHLPWRQDIFLSRESPYEVNFDAYITAAEVKADHRNPFGAVTGGLLKLCGRLMCRGTVMLEPGRQHPQHILIIWDHLRPLTTGVLWMDDDDAITEQVLCVYLGHDRALILEHATESHDLYRRIGLFFWATPSTGKDDATVMLMERVKSAPRQIFTII